MGKIVQTQNAVNLFANSFSKYFASNYANGSDVYSYPDIPEMTKNTVRDNFGLSLEEEILYFRDTSMWNSQNQGTVITNERFVIIPDNDQMDAKLSVEWAYVDKAEYNSGNIYVHTKKFDEPLCLYLYILIKEKDQNRFKYKGEYFAQLFNALATNSYYDETEDIERKNGLLNDFHELCKAEEYDKAIEVGSVYNEENGPELVCEIAKIYAYSKHTPDNAILYLDKMIEKYGPSDNQSLMNQMYYLKSNIYHDMGNNIEARKDCLYVKNNADVNTNISVLNLHDIASKDFEEYENDYVNNFLSQPYKQRKLLMTVDKYTDLHQKILSVVDINNMPDISLPVGHPVIEGIYIGHPFVPQKYVPLDGYEFEFLKDRIMEFCHVMQSLGAKEINIEYLNSRGNEKDVLQHSNYELSGKRALVSFKGGYASNGESNLLEELSRSINLHQRFTPSGKIGLPSNLVWYPNEPSWQRICEQRMQGSLLEHDEKIETKSVQVVHLSELKQLKADIKVFSLVNVKGNVDSFVDETLFEHENIVLSIHVKFAPTMDAEGDRIVKQPLAGAKDFIEDIKDNYANKKFISEKGKGLFNKFKTKFDDVTKKIEESVNSSLTSKENEYLEAYKASLSKEGTISPGERRLLDRMMKAYGISSERAKEIEDSVK